MNWQQAIGAFSIHLTLEKGLSANTNEAYLRDVQKLADCYAVVAPAAVEPLHIEQFMAYLHDLGVADYSQARILSGIKAFYKFLVQELQLPNDPTALVAAPRLRRHLPDVLSVEELNAILAAIDLSRPEGTRNRAMLETLYGCGLRVSELVGLKMSQLYFDIGFVKVEGKGNKERFVPIHADAQRYINLYLTHFRSKQQVKPGAETFVFLNRRGAPLTRVMVFTIVKELAALAGVQKTVSPHTFRHSFATHLVEGGADLRAVQEMLGHESITTTEIYTHLDMSYLRSVIQLCHPRHKHNVT